MSDDARRALNDLVYGGHNHAYVSLVLFETLTAVLDGCDEWDEDFLLDGARKVTRDIRNTITAEITKQ